MVSMHRVSIQMEPTVPRQTESVPNQPRTPNRAIRVPDVLWDKALEVAKSRGETLSDVMRDALSEYVRKYGKADK